jgi:hypothetical protein
MVCLRNLSVDTLHKGDTEDNNNYNINNALKAQLNPICHLLALLRAHHILHVSRVRVNNNNNNNVYIIYHIYFCRKSTLGTKQFSCLLLLYTTQ